MTLIKPGACHSAFCQDDIFPVGQAVVVRIPHSGNFLAENRPAASIRYFPSVALADPSQAIPSRNGNCPGMLRCFPVSALPGLFSRTRYFAAFMNLFGPFQAARRFFTTLRQLRQSALGAAMIFRAEAE